jgi:hypothetical protein
MVRPASPAKPKHVYLRDRMKKFEPLLYVIVWIRDGLFMLRFWVM